MSLVLTDGNDETDDISSASSRIYALDGHDIVRSTAPQAYIYGGNGNDYLAYTGAGVGELYGEAGNDTLRGGVGLTDYLDGGSGDDLLIGGRYSTTRAYAGHIEQIEGTISGEDHMYGGDGSDSLWGFEGDDVLYGEDGDDSADANVFVHGHTPGAAWAISGGLYGGAGNDYLDGGRGNDYLDGGTGADIMLGGPGNDTYIVDNVRDVVSEAVNSGFDIVRTTLDRYILPIEFEGLKLTGEADLVAYGRSTNDLIWGNEGDNILFGDAGNDFLDGAAGNDTFSGGAGDDRLSDIGGGNDQFVFTGAWGADTIVGFEAGPGVGDTIYFQKSAFADIAAVVAGWSDVDGNVIITAANGSRVTILGVTTAQLAGNDFVFGS